MALVATPTQLNDINNALSKLSTYIATLQSASHAAAVAGNTTVLHQLTGPFLDASALEQQLTLSRTMTDIAALDNAITSIKSATTNLDNQKKQIDGFATAVGIVGQVLGQIAAVATAVAAI